jgi:hypothetical protein
MDSEQWLRTADADLMLDFLYCSDRLSERKLRLFLVACAYAVWDQLTSGTLREAVEVGELLADNIASEADRLRCVAAVREIPLAYHTSSGENWFHRHPPEVVSAYFAAQLTVGNYRGCGGRIFTRVGWQMANRATGLVRVGLLRELFGSPFVQSPIDPSWLTPDVVSLAQSIYDRKMFSDMPALAEALSRSTCTDEVILSHCRDAGVHIRGCWVLDLILGRS